MATISELRELAQRKSEEHRRLVERAMQLELRRFGNSLRASLRDELDTTLSVTQQQLQSNISSIHQELQAATEQIERQHRAMNRAHWLRLLYPATAAILITLAGWGVLEWYTYRLGDLREQIAQAETTLQTLEQNGGKIHLSVCGEHRRLCAQVENEPVYEDGFRVLITGH